jgi:hypothetical protein
MEISDHTPLLLNTRIPSQQNSHLFKFDLSWLFKDGLYDMVTKLLDKEKRGSTPM